MPSEMTCGSVVDDKTPLPPLGTTEEEEFILLQDEAYIYGPIKVMVPFSSMFANHLDRNPSSSV
jgi:hypothetical protein